MKEREIITAAEAKELATGWKSEKVSELLTRADKEIKERATDGYISGSILCGNFSDAVIYEVVKILTAAGFKAHSSSNGNVLFINWE